THSFLAERWNQIAYLTHQAKERKLIQPVVLGLLHGVALARVGAVAEGLVQLHSSATDLDRDTRLALLETVLTHYTRAGATEKTRSLTEELDRIRQKLAAR